MKRFEMMQAKLKYMLLMLLTLAQMDGMAEDHPGLTAADEAYSAENYEQAAALYRRDAELGVIAAQVNLAFLYLDGQGVSQDFQQAADWFLRAAEQGNAEAQDNIGTLYQQGKGIAQDKVEADKWFIIAGASGKAAAVEQQMTTDQIVEARKRAEQWLSNFKKAKGH